MLHPPARTPVDRGISLLAAIAVLATTPSLWGAATGIGASGASGSRSDPRLHAAVLVLVVVGGGALLLVSVLVLAVRRSRAAVALDAVVLGVGAAFVLASAVLVRATSDEGVLTGQAATAFLHGRPVYGQSWAFLFGPDVARTPTMDGGWDTTYAYPPGAVLIVAAFRALLGHPQVAGEVVGALALIAGTAGAWLLVPPARRSLVTAAGFGITVLAADARAGYPAVIAVALLVPVVAAWHRLGADGRLGTSGVLRAAALGAGCAVHQTAWFLVPFLLAGILTLRRPEVGARRALLVVIRFAGVAALVWTAVDAPFALAQPGPWARGIVLPLTQHAIVHGQGLVDLTQFLTGGSGAVAFYGAAQLALLAGSLVLLVQHPSRLAAALPLLPAVSWFVGPRSSADYVLLLAPLALVGALTVPSPVPGARPLVRLPDRLGAIVVAVALLPAVVCAGVAVLTPSPLDVQVTGETRTHGRVDVATVLLRNDGGTTVRPHFFAQAGTHPSWWWRIRSGPADVAPGVLARYTLVPDGRRSARTVVEAGSGGRLVTVTASPETVTNSPFPP